MFSEHPYIERAYIRETFDDNGAVKRTLFVKTNLKNPQEGNLEDKSAWSDLQNYLGTLAANDFADFGSIYLSSNCD